MTANDHDPAPPRLPALDRLRGIVMAVMAVDHCDAVFNPAHAQGDSVAMLRPGPLSVPDFLTRWCTHLCAPTFVFLAGVGMALSIGNSERRGEQGAAVDRHWLVRGLVLVALEMTLVSFYWRQEGESIAVVLQVLYAIGTGLVAMVALRRLPVPPLVVLALLLPVAVELLYEPVRFGPDGPRSAPLWNGLLFSGGFYSLPWGSTFVLYPLVPWLTPMLLGWCFGARLRRDGGPASAARLLLWTGAAALCAFAVVRGASGFGNLLLQRRDGSLVEWLHCSKYPPSASFLLLELGLMALLGAALLHFGNGPRRRDPLLVLGQVPLFYYLLHLPLIGALAVLGVFASPSPWSMSWLAAGVTAALALPFCWWYRALKLRRQNGWLRLL